MAGAVLTQNTAWTNVEKAIARLVAANCLTPESIIALSPLALAELIRPAGYFNVKARRLQSFCQFLLDAGGIAILQREPTEPLRQRLLAVHGVGPETADDILLYAFERPVFVVDAYTRRIGGRMGLIDGTAPYETIRITFEKALGPDVMRFNELHALIVRHAKDACRKRPQCDACCLGSVCPGRIILNS
jgi:endonuclease III related protein